MQQIKKKIIIKRNVKENIKPPTITAKEQHFLEQLKSSGVLSAASTTPTSLPATLLISTPKHTNNNQTVMADILSASETTSSSLPTNAKHTNNNQTVMADILSASETTPTSLPANANHRYEQP